MNISPNKSYYETFKPFLKSNDFKSSFQNTIKPLPHKEESLNKQVLLGSAIGTLLPILTIQKYQKKAVSLETLKKIPQEIKLLFKSVMAGNLKEAQSPSLKKLGTSFKIDYGLKEMLMVSVGAILGGLSGGIASDKGSDHTTKIKESLFQISNVSVTTSLITVLLGVAKKLKNEKSAPKIAAVICGISAGMPIAVAVSNKINNIFFNQKVEDNRKLKVKDSYVHIDDFLGALVLAKVPFADKIHIDKIMPLLFMSCGYEAGSKE